MLSVQSLYATELNIANPLVHQLVRQYNQTTLTQYFHGTKCHEDAIDIIKNGVQVRN